jgi:alcohol dehydrogenase class IV
VAYEDPDNLMARERLAFVSMLSGVCLANSGLAMAHGIAAALGALFDVPHGLACGILLPHTLEYNRKACEQELRDALAAFMNQTTPNDQTIDDGMAAIRSLGRWLQIPENLKYLRLSDDDIRKVAEASMGSSMSGNPIEMTPALVEEFLKKLV